MMHYDALCCDMLKRLKCAAHRQDELYQVVQDLDRIDPLQSGTLRNRTMKLKVTHSRSEPGRSA
jgi:hypothetical protein